LRKDDSVGIDPSSSPVEHVLEDVVDRARRVSVSRSLEGIHISMR